jgi:hypothetical protein
MVSGVPFTESNLTLIVGPLAQPKSAMQARQKTTVFMSGTTKECCREYASVARTSNEIYPVRLARAGGFSTGPRTPQGRARIAEACRRRAKDRDREKP